MIAQENEWQENLTYILREEISIYRSLVLLEKNKKEAILNSKARDLEAYTKQTSNLLLAAGEAETRRMKSLNDAYKSEQFKMDGESPILTEFLSQLKEEQKSKLENLAEELRKVVSELKEMLNVNENILKSKQEIFQLTIEALIAASEVGQSAEYGSSTKSKSRTNLMLNTKV
jgi:flagellar biosynthesis/type III secretory pathway chaperone